MVSKADLGVSLEMFKANAFDSGIGEESVEIGLGKGQNPVQIKRLPFGIKFKIFVCADGSFLLERAGQDALVAAEEAVADFGSEVERDLAFVFDSQITDAF